MGVAANHAAAARLPRGLARLLRGFCGRGVPGAVLDSIKESQDAAAACWILGRSPNPALSRCEGRGQAEAVLAVRVERRGRNPLPPLVLYSQAPFAMAGAWALVDTGARVLAYAAPIEHEPPSSETGESEGKGMAKQGGEDVSHLAERVEGEPLAVAAWKQFAKTGKLLSKKMEEESGQTPSLISYRDYERVGDADFAAGCMTDRLLKAERDARRYVVELPNETIPEQLGQREKALAAIALM